MGENIRLEVCPRTGPAFSAVEFTRGEIENKMKSKAYFWIRNFKISKFKFTLMCIYLFFVTFVVIFFLIYSVLFYFYIFLINYLYLFSLEFLTTEEGIMEK